MDAALDNLTLPVGPPLGIEAPGFSNPSEAWYSNLDSPVYTEVWRQYRDQCFEMADQLASSGDSSERLAQVDHDVISILDRTVDKIPCPSSS